MSTQATSTTTAIYSSPKAAHAALLARNAIHMDEAQLHVLDTLQSLHESLQLVVPSGLSRLKRLFVNPTKDQKGLYIYGDVGRGKSMLMDLFFQTLPDIPKQRVHFHQFMQELHKDFHEFRRTQTDDHDPVTLLISKLAHDVKVLCFDELQATDVADATIITRLFQGLFEHGVIIIATSNRAPKDIYTGGVQKERFDHLTALLNKHMQVMCLNGEHDHRMRQIQGLMQTYFSPLGAGANDFIAKTLKHLCPTDDISTLLLDVNGRELAIKIYGGKIATASFDELCARPLGAADYLAIAQAAEVLVLVDIPKLSAEKRNEAKRFVTLIDALYEHKIKLIATAEVPPHELYREGHGSFEFERTVSRLIEMQSENYLKSTKYSP